MSQTQTKPVSTKVEKPRLNLAELRTVRWILNAGLVKQGTKYVADKRMTSRRIPVLSWIILSIEMVFISIFLFIHSIPWPNWIMEIIFKIDRVIESVLELVTNRVEWWWDNVSVRLMRLREMIEALIDAILSLCLFFVYKFFEMCMWIAGFAIGIVKVFFAPVIVLTNAVLPPSEKMKEDEVAVEPESTESTEGILKSDFPVHKRLKEREQDDAPSRLSGSSSECESDVSIVSESWSIGHTDKLGKSYNRVQTKVTAEGRFRAAMYKRVKSQLRLMRKNSINFSRDVTSYARQLVAPKVAPAFQSFQTFLRSAAQKYGFVEVFVSIGRRVNKFYVVSVFVQFSLSALAVPLNILNKFLLARKKKSRRTRSMRSESLRRRTGAGSSPLVPATILEPFGLSKSEEPVVTEEQTYSNISQFQQLTSKVEDDTLRDSALPSSTDDLCHNSDSNDGSVFLRDQITGKDVTCSQPNEYRTNQNYHKPNFSSGDLISEEKKNDSKENEPLSNIKNIHCRKQEKEHLQPRADVSESISETQHKKQSTMSKKDNPEKEGVDVDHKMQRDDDFSQDNVTASSYVKRNQDDSETAKKKIVFKLNSS